MSIPELSPIDASPQFARPEEHLSHHQEADTDVTKCTISREIRNGPRIALQSLRETSYVIDKWSTERGSTLP